MVVGFAFAAGLLLFKVAGVAVFFLRLAWRSKLSNKIIWFLRLSFSTDILVKTSSRVTLSLSACWCCWFRALYFFLETQAPKVKTKKNVKINVCFICGEANLNKIIFTRYLLRG